MEYTIDSKKIGRPVTFSRPGSSYLYVDLNGKPGTLGNQICHGGTLRGDTIEYSGDSEEVFKRICKRWYNAHLKKDGWYYGDTWKY